MLIFYNVFFYLFLLYFHLLIFSFVLSSFFLAGGVTDCPNAHSFTQFPANPHGIPSTRHWSRLLGIEQSAERHRFLPFPRVLVQFKHKQLKFKSVCWFNFFMLIINKSPLWQAPNNKQIPKPHFTISVIMINWINFDL